MIIFYLGKSYSLLLRNNQDLLFNSNHNSNLKEFNKYLSMQKYKFKNDGFETGGYALLENKIQFYVLILDLHQVKSFLKIFKLEHYLLSF